MDAVGIGITRSLRFSGIFSPCALWVGPFRMPSLPAGARCATDPTAVANLRSLLIDWVNVAGQRRRLWVGTVRFCFALQEAEAARTFQRAPRGVSRSPLSDGDGPCVQHVSEL